MKKSIALILACLLVLAVATAAGADGLKTPAQEAAEKIVLPAALMQTVSYQLPVPAYDGGKLQLTVNGTACDGSYTAEGTQAELIYSDESGTTVASYLLPVVDTHGGNDLAAYFHTTSGTVTKTVNENDITLSFSHDSQVQFIHALNSEPFSLFLSPVEGKTGYGTMELTLTDAENGRNVLTVTLDMAAGTVTYGSQSAELGSSDTMQLHYKNSTHALCLGETQLLVCEDVRFSGAVYLSIAFRNVTADSQLRITRINNQPMGHKNSTLLDMTEPTMVLTSALHGTQYYGQTFDIPGFVAYDVLNPVREQTVKVESPDGTEYTEPFTIDQYGKYKLSFLAKDTCGNTMKITKIIFVNDDVAPELSVENMEKTAYKVGDSVSIPAYTASDNLGVYNVDVILFLPNGEIRLLTNDASGEITYCLTDSMLYAATFRCDEHSFRLEQAGSYTLRYVAYDDQYNRVTHTLTFTAG